MPKAEANYVKVDQDGDAIMVYDQLELMEVGEFWFDDYPSKSACRAEAERYAKAEAERLGCDWGCNY